MLETAQGAAEFDAIVVLFDPDEDPAESERQFFERDWDRSAQSEVRLDRSTAPWVLHFRGRKRHVHLIPWRTPADARFDGLSNEHNLERVLIEGLVRSGAPLGSWVERTAADLLAQPNAADHGWKRAFRLWYVAVSPLSLLEESFAKRLLNSRDFEACRAADRLHGPARLG